MALDTPDILTDAGAVLSEKEHSKFSYFLANIEKRSDDLATLETELHIHAQIEGAVEAEYTLDELETMPDEESENLDLMINILMGYELSTGDLTPDLILANNPRLSRVYQNIRTGREEQIDQYVKRATELTQAKNDMVEVLEDNIVETVIELQSRIDYSLAMQQEDFYSNLFNEILPDLDTSPVSSQNIPTQDRYNYLLIQHLRLEQSLQILEDQHLLLETPTVLPTHETLDRARETILQIAEIRAQIHYHNDVEQFSTNSRFVATPDVVSYLGSYRYRSIDEGVLPAFLEHNPYALAAIGSQIEDDMSQLGELHKHITWKNTLSTEKIYDLIVQLEASDALPDLNLAQEIIDRHIRRYKQTFDKDISGRKLTAEMTLEKRFVDAVVAYRYENQPLLPVDQRILSSQMLALHYLFMSKGIEGIYDEYLANLEEGARPKNREEAIQVKAELAFKFLESQERKNRELEMASVYEGITIGVEYEYDDGLEALISNRKKIERKIAKDEKLLEDPSLSPEMRASIEAVISHHKNYIESMEIWLYGKSGKEAIKDETTELVMFCLSEPTLGQILSDLGAHRMDPHYAVSYREMITHPSASYKMVMRDLLNIMASGEMQGSQNIHFTIGGMELSPKHPDASELRAITTAAGYSAKELIANQSYLNEVLDPSYIATETESFWKLSMSEGQFYYLPFHYSRSRQDMEKYPSSFTTPGWESRSYGSEFASEKRLKDRLRTIKFNYLASRAIKAATTEGYKTDLDQRLSQRWEEFNTEWKKLLSEVGIEYPELEERYMKVNVLLEPEPDNPQLLAKGLEYEQGEKHKYATYLDRLDAMGEMNPTFRRKTQVLVHNFNRDISKMIGVNPSSANNTTDENMITPLRVFSF